MNSESYPKTMSANAETVPVPKPQGRRFDGRQLWLSSTAVFVWILIARGLSWSGWQVLFAGIGIAVTLAVADAVCSMVHKRRREAAAGGSSS